MSTIYDPLHDCKMIGALRAMHGISDCYTIIHGRNGCHCGAMLLQTMGSDQNNVRVLSSGLKKSDEVHSGEERLVAAIQLADKTFCPEVITVLSCSAPVIMGEDVEGLQNLLDCEIHATLFAQDVGGPEGPAWQGYEHVLYKLVSSMKCSNSGFKSGVNIIGYKSDDFCSGGDIKEIKRILELQNVNVNSVLCGSSFAEIQRAPDSELNILLGGDGILCAKRMQETFGIPYIVVPYPYGLKKSIVFIEMILSALGKTINSDIIENEKSALKSTIERVHMYLQGIYSTPVAVIGESGRAFDLAEFLSDELGMDVKLLVLSAVNSCTANKIEETKNHIHSLLIEPDRFVMNQRIRENEVSLIFGSSMEKKIANEISASLIRISYPVIDQVSLSDQSFAGFSGIKTLCEVIINSILCRIKEED